MSIFLFSSCSNSKHAEKNFSQLAFESLDTIEDSKEILKILYNSDLHDRKNANLKWSRIVENDNVRLIKVKELLKDSSLFSALDYTRAALIFQHGKNSANYKLAIDMMSKAIKLDPNTDKWLYFAANDRYLLSIRKPQIFGTQYRSSESGLVLISIDTTSFADSIRNSYPELSRVLKDRRERLGIINN
jgi:hypothetical protein